MSICLAYWNLFKRGDSPLFKRTCIAIYATAAACIGYYVAAFFLNIFQCTPIAKAWHPEYPGYCVNLNAVGYFNAALDIITSAILMAIPLPLLAKLGSTRPEAVQIMALISLGMV